MFINSENLDAIRVGFTNFFDAGVTAAKPQYKSVAMEVPATGKQQKYGWLGSNTQFREWLGDRVIQNLSSHDFSIANKSFENSIGVDRDEIEDDTLGVYNPMFQMMGNNTAMHPDSLVFPLMKNAFTTLCYDGQYLCDTDHPYTDANGVQQSVSNSGGGGGNPWFLLDTTKPLRPFIFQTRRPYDFVAMDQPTATNVFKQKKFLYGVDARVNAGVGLWQLIYGSKQVLNAANYETSRAAMMAFLGDNGQPLNITPNLIVCGPSNEAAAKQIVKADRNAAGATNVDFGTADIIVTPWLP